MMVQDFKVSLISHWNLKSLNCLDVQNREELNFQKYLFAMLNDITLQVWKFPCKDLKNVSIKLFFFQFKAETL